MVLISTLQQVINENKSVSTSPLRIKACMNKMSNRLLYINIKTNTKRYTKSTVTNLNTLGRLAILPVGLLIFRDSIKPNATYIHVQYKPITCDVQCWEKLAEGQEQGPDTV